MQFIQKLKKEVEDLIGVRLNSYDYPVIRHILTTALLVAAHFKKGVLDEAQVANTSLIFEGILNLQLQAIAGDKSAESYYKAIDKLVFPPKMIRSEKNKKKAFLPTVNKIVENNHSSPELLRTYEIRKLMSELSFIIEPVCNCSNPKNLDELLKLTIETEKVSDKTLAHDNIEDFCQCYELKPNSKFKFRTSKSIKKKRLFTEAVNITEAAKKSEKLSLTWERLAKRIYLQRICNENPNSNLDANGINRSIRKLKEFEEEFPDQVSNSIMLPVLNGEDLLYQILTPFKL